MLHLWRPARQLDAAWACSRAAGSRSPTSRALSPAPPPVEVEHEAWFVPPDLQGLSTFGFGSHSTGERWQVADVRIHDQVGIVEVRTGEASGSVIRSLVQGGQGTRVPLEWARWQVAKAQERNAKSGVVVPMGLKTAASLIEPVPEAEPPHPIDAAKLDLQERDIEPRAKTSESLHFEPEFHRWMADNRAVEELLRKVGERLGAAGKDVEQGALNVMFSEEVSAATDRAFTPEIRTVLASRMRDCAISVLARSGPNRALDVLATAEAIKRAGLITSPPSEIPFLRGFFQKAINVLASQSGGQLNVPVPKAAAGEG